MANIATITAFDGAVTPATHTLHGVAVSRPKPNQVLAEWREATSPLPLEAQVRCALLSEKLKSGTYRMEFRSVVPVMESVNGANAAGYTAAPDVAFEDTLITVGYFNKRSTKASRTLAAQLHINLINGVTTSVTPDAVGPFALAFQNMLMPT